jgi:hypothetical protein
LYGIQAEDFFSVDSNGTRTNIGSINSTSGPVDFASTLSQLCITDGSYLHVYQPSTGAFEVSVNYPGGDRIAFIDQRIVFITRGTQRFGWTALDDARNIAFLDFASAEGSPDELVSLLTSHREVWLFGVQSTEIWNSVGGQAVFERNPSAYMEYGCAAPNSAQKSANSVTWLSRDEKGQAMVMRAQGYQPSRISTRAIEERFQGIDVSNARAFTYSDGGQQFYCLNVPGVNSTLTYDETFQQWHERAELVNGDYRQWRATCHAFAYGRHFVGANNDIIYRLDKDVHLFGDDPICRERVVPVISANNRNLLRFPMVEVICEKATTAQIMLSWSDDNGATWSSWNYASAGNIGQFAKTVRFHRTGAARDRVYRIRCTDDAAFNPVQMVAEVM